MIEELLTGDFDRLRNVVRWSIVPRNHNENVAEHSYYTALYALVLALELRESGFTVGVESVLMKALLHDVEESISGDFVRTYKHSHKGLHKAIEAVNVSLATKMFQPYSHAGPELFENWRHAKDHTCEGLLVKFADFLSVLSYVIREVSLGNKAIYRWSAEIERYSDTFLGKEYSFLGDWIHEARVIARNPQREIKVMIP